MLRRGKGWRWRREDIPGDAEDCGRDLDQRVERLAWTGGTIRRGPLRRVSASHAEDTRFMTVSDNHSERMYIALRRLPAGWRRPRSVCYY